MIRTVLALAALLPLALPAAAQVTLPTNTQSGMPWPSGANGGSGGAADLEALRGRPLDIRAVFLPMDTWSNIANNAGNATMRNYAAAPYRVEVGVSMLPETHRGQHQACANGAFDANVRQWGTALINAGAADAIVRLGWEANRVGGYPSAVVVGQEAAYINCWRKQVTVLRALPNQRFVFSWAMQDKGSKVVGASAIYPGNAYLDIVAVNPYDRCPPARTEADWTRIANAKHQNGVDPAGTISWLNFAKGKGKKFALAEWGLGSTTTICSDPGFDNPFFIRKMHGMLAANASAIGYESYFNGHGDGRSNTVDPADGRSTRLAPATWNPKASAVYVDLW